MKNKWLNFLIIALISVFVLAACGSDEEAESESGNNEDVEQNTEETENTSNEEENSNNTGEDAESFVIGATQIVEHPSLDAAYQGFQDAIADAGLDVEYDYQSAQNDPNNAKPIADGFVADNVDLIFANSTPSAQAAKAATNDIPIIFTSVTDAVGTDLVEAMDQPGENITGIVDLHPDSIKNTVTFIDTYFEGASVGLIYNKGEPNSVTQIEAVKAEIDGTSLSTVESTVSSSSEVNQAAESLVGQADVFFIITDNTVVDALEAVVGVANEQNIPMVVGEPDSVKKGGFATFGIDYHTIGYIAGEMAVEVLTGQKTTSDIPVEIPPEMQLFINKDAAEEQGIEWNTEWDEEAQFLETEEE